MTSARICKSCESAPVVRDSNLCRKCKTRMDSERRRREVKPTIAEIRAKLSKEDPEYLEHLESLHPQELEPKPLVDWVREVFRVGRNEHLDDTVIVQCIQVYARKGKWTDKQIAAVLDRVL